MSAQHTPGPWRVGRVGSVVSDHPVNGRPLPAEHAEYYGGELICESIGTKADARLIAKAPELKAIVDALVSWWDENGGTTGPHAGTLFDETRTWNDVAHTLLAAIDGGQ